MPLRHSPLHDRHVALGAKFAEFGGWEMPLEYAGGGVLKEHAAVRDSVGVFDVSHLGKLVLRGPGAKDHLDARLTNSFDRIAPGQAQYTLACDDATGGIVDDLIAYYLADDHVLLVPNAANTAEVARRLEADLPDGLTLEDHHTTRAVLAVQGQRSDEVLAAVGLPTGHDYMSFAQAPLGDREVLVCRTGYTGERGYELICDSEDAPALWDALLREGAAYDVAPCGLGARDTLRTEMGYPLHGQDISLEVTPVEARLRWAVGWDKPAFWGRDVLLAQREEGPPVVLRGLLSRGRGIARPGMGVDLDGAPVGRVTSGTFSPTLRQGIALALLDRGVEVGAEVGVDVRGRPQPFEVTTPPFVQTGVRS